MQIITLNIPEEILINYKSPDELKRVIYEDVVAKEFGKGNISIRQGAAMLGLSYEQFMTDFLGSRGLSFISGTSESLESEFRQEDMWLDELLGNGT